MSDPSPPGYSRIREDGLEEEDDIDMQVEALRERAQREAEQAEEFYKVRFADLPSLQRVRERWLARGIREDDPVFMLIEVLSLHDARDQMAHKGVERLLMTFQEATGLYISKVATAAEDVARSRQETQMLLSQVKQIADTAQALGNYTSQLAQEMPSIVESMRANRQLLDVATPGARWHFVGMIAAAVAAGVVIGLLFAR
jgi:hypothetical protein